MLASIQFKKFKALRSASLRMERFNLVLGPSGSGKTSLIESLLRLRTLSALPVATEEIKGQREVGPRIHFRFNPPFEKLEVMLGCNSDELVCNQLAVTKPSGPDGEKLWEQLRARLRTVRAYLFDHYAMTVPPKTDTGAELASNAGNLAAVLARWKSEESPAFAALEGEFKRLMPEFQGLEFRSAAPGHVELVARLIEDNQAVTAENLSQGTLYLLATLALAYAPRPPAVVCLEEADRGMHPRMLREIRDALYRLSYPKELGLERDPVQVIATTHSPYLLDLFRDHPEEIVFAHKHGRAATFQRLSERADIMELMKDAHLGDLWYSGILGGIPGE